MSSSARPIIPIFSHEEGLRALLDEREAVQYDDPAAKCGMIHLSVSDTSVEPPTPVSKMYGKPLVRRIKHTKS